MMNTEELSLIVAALAVVVGPAVTYKLGARGFQHERSRDAARFQHERAMTDLADLRSVMAAGALPLHEAKETMRDNLGDFDSPLAIGEGWPDDFSDRIRTLERRRDEIEAVLADLQIRLAETEPATVALLKCWEALRSLISVYVIAYRHRGPAGAAARERKDDHAEAWKFSEEFDDKRADYLRAARELVGAQVEEEELSDMQA